MILFLLLSCSNKILSNEVKALNEAWELYVQNDFKGAIFHLESKSDAISFLKRYSEQESKDLSLILDDEVIDFLFNILGVDVLKELDKLFISNPLEWLKKRYDASKKNFQDLSAYLRPLFSIVSVCPEKYSDFLVKESENIISEYFRQELDDSNNNLETCILFMLANSSHFIVPKIVSSIEDKKKMEHLFKSCNSTPVEYDMEDEEDVQQFKFTESIKQFIKYFINSLLIEEKIVFSKSINKIFKLEELYKIIYNSECNVDIKDFRTLLEYVKLFINSKQFDEAKFRNALNFLGDIVDLETLSFDFIENSGNMIHQQLIIDGRLEEAIIFISKVVKSLHYKEKLEQFLNLKNAATLQSVKDMLVENINLQDSQGKTLLMWASHHGYEEIVDLLLRLGANVDSVYKVEV